jgi:hypothetical protein
VCVEPQTQEHEGKTAEIALCDGKKSVGYFYPKHALLFHCLWK